MQCTLQKQAAEVKQRIMESQAAVATGGDLLQTVQVVLSKAVACLELHNATSSSCMLSLEAMMEL